MVLGDAFAWVDRIPQEAEKWLPFMFLLLTVFIVWLLWRTVSMMPRTKPAQITPNSASSVSWDSVAGNLQDGGDLVAGDGWKVLEEVVDSVAGCEVVQQYRDRDASA